jgi:hypothetical protein
MKRQFVYNSLIALVILIGLSCKKSNGANSVGDNTVKYLVSTGNETNFSVTYVDPKTKKSVSESLKNRVSWSKTLSNLETAPPANGNTLQISIAGTEKLTSMHAYIEVNGVRVKTGGCDHNSTANAPCKVTVTY